MSLDVYSRVIAPDEVDPNALTASLTEKHEVLEESERDAPVMHGGGS